MDKVKFIFASVGVIFASVFGGWDKLLQALLTLTVLDIVTGVMLAAAKKEVSSSVAMHGFAKKVGIYVLVGVAVALDGMFGTAQYLRGATIGFFIGVEGLSIIENWGGFGLPLPRKLKEVLKQLQEKSEKDA